MHARVALLTALAGGALALAPPARAIDVPVRKLPGAAGLTAYGGWVVWSARDATTGRWSLWRWHEGRTRALPAGTQPLPFDADAGPDRRGRPVVVFSRCTAVPAPAAGQRELASGCDLWSLRLGGGRPRRLPGVSTRAASETRPAIWRDGLAFQRRSPGAAAGELWLRRPGTRRLRRLAVPSAPSGGSAVAAQLDLGPHALTVLWGSGTADEVLLYLGARDPLTLVREPAQPGLAIDLVGPNAAGRGAVWGASGAAAGQAPSGGFFAYDARARAGARVAAPDLPRAVALDGGVVWWLRGGCPSGPPACELIRSTGLDFRPFPITPSPAAPPAGRAGPARPAAGP